MKRATSCFNKIKKEFALFLLLSITSTTTFAQAPIRGVGLELSLKGRILNSTNNQPVEYATVAAFEKKSNKLLSGIITDAQGNFIIEGIHSKNLYLNITFMGFQTLRVDSIPVTSTQTVEFGNIALAPAVEQLNEVQVVAKTRSIEYQLDKKVIDVASQMTAASATAIEVLENVPSVKVDMDGTVSLRGSTGFTVLIDGKPSNLDPSDALRSLPASSIQKMEIITNPSAKYQPDGTAGIINVIMKRNRSNGLNGVANANIGLYETYGGDFLLNYRANKINYNIGADYNCRNFPGTIESQRTTHQGDTTINTNNEGSRNRTHTMMSLKGGLDYDFTPNDAFSLGFRLGLRNMDTDGNQNYLEQYTVDNSLASLPLIRSTTTADAWRKGSFGSLNFGYLHKFASKPDHTLKFSVDMNSSTGKEYAQTEKRDSLLRPMDGKINREDGPRKNLQASVDYSLPISEGSKFETGYMGRYESLTKITSMDTLNLLTSVYEGNPAYYNNSLTTQNIQALYSTFSGTLKALSYQLGLRGEFTNRVITSEKENQTFSLNGWDYFPTLHLSYKLPNEHEVMASYSRRIERTHGGDLEPFTTWSDAYNVRRGNPDLKNQYIDAFEMGYMKQYKLFYLSLEGYYRITNNKIERIKTAFEGNNNIIMQSPFNVGKDYALGVEGSINTTLFKFWEANLSGTAYNYQITGQMNGYSFDSESFNWNSRLNNTFSITKNQRLQFNGFYNSKTVTSQGSNSAYFAFDAGYRIDFNDKKISLLAQGRDLFATAKRESYTTAPFLIAHDLYRSKAPMVTLTLTYRINNYKAKKGSNGQASDNGSSEE